MPQPIKVGLMVPILAILMVMACTSGRSKPTFIPIPTPTTPPSFVKYSDELSRFSIEYPREWQLATSQMVGLKDFVEGKVDDLLDVNDSLEDTAMVFIAGDADFENHVSILVTSLPSKMTVDELYEIGEATLIEEFPSLEVHRISKIQVDGRSAVLQESTFEGSELDPSLSGSVPVTQLIFVLDKAAWFVTCHYYDASRFAQTCESIVRSIRILE